MTVELEQLGNEPIIIATILEPVDPAEDAITNRDYANSVARKFDGLVYRITDFSRFDMTFSQLTVGLAQDIKFAEPNIQHLFVGTGQWVELAKDAGNQQQYGLQDIMLFASLDEAIAFARMEIQSA